MTALELQVQADARAPGRVRAELRRWLAEHEWPEEEGEDLVLAVSEAVSNSAEHAYSTERSAAGARRLGGGRRHGAARCRPAPRQGGRRRLRRLARQPVRQGVPRARPTPHRHAHGQLRRRPPQHRHPGDDRQPAGHGGRRERGVRPARPPRPLRRGAAAVARGRQRHRPRRPDRRPTARRAAREGPRADGGRHRRGAAAGPVAAVPAGHGGQGDRGGGPPGRPDPARSRLRGPHRGRQALGRHRAGRPQQRVQPDPEREGDLRHCSACRWWPGERCSACCTSAR